MVISAIRNAVMSCALCSSFGSLCVAQQQSAKKAPITHTTTPASGAELYKQYCAVCHGNDLKGNGPAPAPFKRSPPDLTTLARRHDGKFPYAYVSDVLRNGIKTPDHASDSGEMPVWGTLFTTIDRSDQTQVTLRITNLTVYVESRQAK
jgi:mono/diheme cytochrome c family protein